MNNIKTILGLVAFVGLLGLTESAMAQCTISLPSGSWTGSSQQGVGNVYGTNNNVTITDLGNNQFEISDFSGGFIGHFGFSDDNSIIVEIDCNNDVLTVSSSTVYGPCNITSGTWDPNTNTITIDWELPDNRIVESTQFTIN